MPDSPLPAEPAQRPDKPARLVVGVIVVAAVVLIGALVVGQNDSNDPRPESTAAPETRPATGGPTPTSPSPSPSPTKPTPPPDGVSPDPDSLLVLVDHERSLPEGYVPGDLVLLDVPFAFETIDARRFLRQEASSALNELFSASETDGLPLLGVSGFRSTETQAGLFDEYAARDGVDAADRYSARPGHSEHQTGLAIDVVGADGVCPTEACFADRPEAAWLAAHAHEYGFIIRYPSDGETSTGYLYEPWHLRYVGLAVAAKTHGNSQTLEQHLGLP